MASFPGDLDASWRRSFRTRVLRWYKQHGRSLPWRQQGAAYPVWISEIMLQQTTVAAVIPYFERFIAAFPDLETLAAAQESQVLRMWEGLGYYSRARNIHKSANILVEQYGSNFPDGVEELRKLPGIGRYTAGAIVSFAFRKPAPIVEANTVRLYSRLMELDVAPQSSAGQRLLWEFAEWTVSPKRPADFNQAVMDLGAGICRVADPKCEDCPLKTICGAFRNGRQQNIPIPAKKPTVTAVTAVSIVMRKGSRFLLRQQRESERWAGLWDFVRFEISGADAAAAAADFRSLCLSAEQETGLVIAAADLTPVTEIKHSVTRYRIRLKCFSGQVSGGRIKPASGYRWFSASDLENLALSTTGRSLANLLIQ